MTAGKQNIIDVGCDHGYLSIYLALHGAARVTASDIRPGPLGSAKLNAQRYGVEDRVVFELADGLAFSGADTADAVVAAGMGGETIISILKDAPWVKDDTLLVLQPQSKVEELCEWLAENGFHLTDARLARDSGRLYAVMCAEGGAAGEHSPYPEDLLLKRGDPLLPEWLSAHIARLAAALDGMARSETPRAEEIKLRRSLERFERTEREYKAWQR